MLGSTLFCSSIVWTGLISRARERGQRIEKEEDSFLPPVSLILMHGLVFCQWGRYRESTQKKMRLCEKKAEKRKKSEE